VTHRFVAIAGAAAFCLAIASPVGAQVIRTRPFPGIFGSGDPAKSVTQVDFLSFLGGGFESTKVSLAGGDLGTAEEDYGFGNLVFRGKVAHQGRRTNFGANGGATTSYYGGAGSLSPLSLSGEMNYGGLVGRRGTFALRQSIYYSPYYVVRGATAEPLDDAPPPPPDSAEPNIDPRVDERTARLSTTGYNTFASAGRQVGQNGALFASYGLNYVDFAPGVYDVISHSPRGGYRQRIGRYASFVAAYGLSLYEYRNSPYERLTSHNVLAGVGYDRPLSAWRHTTVGFNVSSAVIRDLLATRFYVNGNAHLYRRFGRTWFTGLTYNRGQQVLEGFAQPFFTYSDTVAGSISGRVGRDVGLSGGVSYSHNTYSIDAFSNVFNTFAGSARIQVPIMWALAVYAEGYYSQHDFQSRLGLIQGVPASHDRLGLRTGLTVSVPVLR